MAQLHDIVVDCRHPASLARFWAAALDDYEVAPYDDAELARLRAAGFDGPEDDPMVVVESRQRPRLLFQLVPESKTVKNRVHLDLLGDDQEEARLVGLGATVVDRQPSWVVLADPEGNEFCLATT